MIRDISSKTDRFFDELQRVGTIDKVQHHHLLQSQSKRVLNAIFRDDRFEHLGNTIRIMLTKWRDNQLDERIGHLFVRKTDIKKQQFLKIKFENKWIEKIRFASIFKRTEVKDRIPLSCQHLEPPVIIYTYG